MTDSRRVFFGASLSLLAIALIASAQAAPETDSALSLQMCLATAADQSPVYPTSFFPSYVTGVSCSFRFGRDRSPSALTHVWIAVDVGEAAPPNYEITRSMLALDGVKLGALTYSQDNPMPVGKYRLDVLVEDELLKSAEFSVIQVGEPAGLRGPDDLLPLEEGHSWSYKSVQEAGEGARISDEDAQPDADGKARTDVTMTVAGSDALGSRIEMRRNGKLVTQEWWRLGGNGLALVQRKVDDMILKPDPPQPLWVLPLDTRRWTYKSDDGTISQACRMWGPLPVKGPRGDTPGYVVYTELPTILGKSSFERHFVPGFGMVREVAVTGLNGALLTRTELTLDVSPDAGRPTKATR